MDDILFIWQVGAINHEVGWITWVNKLVALNASSAYGTHIIFYHSLRSDKLSFSGDSVKDMCTFELADMRFSFLFAIKLWFVAVFDGNLWFQIFNPISACGLFTPQISITGSSSFHKSKIHYFFVANALSYKTGTRINPLESQILFCVLTIWAHIHTNEYFLSQKCYSSQRCVQTRLNAAEFHALIGSIYIKAVA